jgi:hypothetical protein
MNIFSFKDRRINQIKLIKIIGDFLISKFGDRDIIGWVIIFFHYNTVLVIFTVLIINKKWETVYRVIMAMVIVGKLDGCVLTRIERYLLQNKNWYGLLSIWYFFNLDIYFTMISNFLLRNLTMYY